jgi:DNA helicase HerA-like ATPase
MILDKNIPYEPVTNLSIGHIIEVDGTHIIAELHHSLSELSRIYAGEIYRIGQFGSILKIHYGRRLLYSFVGRLRMKSEFQAERGLPATASTDERIIEADLFGEGEWKKVNEDQWVLTFERGVSTFPLPTQTIYLTPKSELRYIYGQGVGSIIKLGYHVGSIHTPCFADLNQLIGKHTAILGSTGSGKSGTVAAIIHSILEKASQPNITKWNPRIIILDPHGEYHVAFSGTRLSTDDVSLHLPYWLLNFQELIALFIGKTEFVATSQVNIVKRALLQARAEGANIIDLEQGSITIDSPVPFKLTTFRTSIEQERKKLTSSKQDSHNSILNKLEVLQNDARLRFMMSEWVEDDNDPIAAIITKLIGGGLQPRIVDLSGVPNEVAGIASAVIARTLFNLKVWQTQEERERDPVLLVCEEAHRYVPNSGEAQYQAAQDAIRRIAKEGRKYGLGLILVSQRPSEIEATVLSQCNSWIVLRITNEADRAQVKSILPDSMSGLVKMLSGLRRQEAIFVGPAANVPSRIMIRDLESGQLPKSNDIDFEKGWQTDFDNDDHIIAVSKRWRYQQK